MTISLNQSTGKILGRTTADSGPTEEISIGTGLSFTSGVLSVNFSALDSVYAPFDVTRFTTVTPSGADASSIFAGVGVGNQTLSPGEGPSYLASANIGIGRETLTNLTTGYGNIGIGLNTLEATTEGKLNVAVGNAVLPRNTTGYGNIGIGYGVFVFNTTGFHNISIGLQSMRFNETGNHNTYVGRDAGFCNTTGNWNVGVGNDANPGNTTGSGNTAIGGETMYGSTLEQAQENQNLTGSNNTMVGYRSGSIDGNQNPQNRTVLGYDAKATADNQVVIGNEDVTETVLRGNVKAPAFWVIGEDGEGYLALPTQTSNAINPSSGFRLYADPSNRLAVKNQAGFIFGFDPAALTNHRYFTLPDASGTLLLGTAGNLPATATNNNAAAGKLGEYVEGILLTGSATSLTTSTAKTVTSISLTAGDWDVDGVVNFNFAATTVATQTQGSLSTTNNTVDSAPGRETSMLYNGVAPGGSHISQPIPAARFSLSSTTTVYLVANAVFTTSTLTAYGIIRARRVR